MLSVVIPALNEEDGIADIVERVEAVQPSLREVGVDSLEIIVVDDGSTDRTAEIAGHFPLVRVVRHSKNRGYGAAIKTGFLNARGQLLAFLDADGTYPPESFAPLCRATLEHDADVAVGSRRSGAESHMPAMRRLGNFIWANLVSLIGNHRVMDPASGMRVIRREALPQLLPLPDGLNFTPVMSTRAVHEELNVVEVPIAYSERLGRSKLSIVHDGTRFLKTIVWTSLEYNPVRILGLLGLMALGAALAIALWMVMLRLQGITQLGLGETFGVFCAVVLAVAGVSLFSLGATFNYLVSLFRRRPVRQGLFGQPLFDRPIDRHFGWVGLLTALAGTVAGATVLALGAMGGWDIARLWFWLLASALLILIGLQLGISWVLMRVLEALSERELEPSMDGTGATLIGVGITGETS
jgi:glycosyltransferase involved in cell wall biosynthesis